MELNLTGKVAVISGGGTGIGKALALEYLKEGVQVCTFGRRLTVLEKFAQECRAGRSGKRTAMGPGAGCCFGSPACGPVFQQPCSYCWGRCDGAADIFSLPSLPERLRGKTKRGASGALRRNGYAAGGPGGAALLGRAVHFRGNRFRRGVFLRL